MKKVFAFVGTTLPILCASLLTGPKAVKANAIEDSIVTIGYLYDIEMVSSRTKVIISDLNTIDWLEEVGRDVYGEWVSGGIGGGGDLPPIVDKPGVFKTKPGIGHFQSFYQQYYYASPTEPIIVGKREMKNTPESVSWAMKYLEGIASFCGYNTEKKNNSVLNYIRTINANYDTENWGVVAGETDISFIQKVNSLTSIGDMTVRDYFASFLERSSDYNQPKHGTCESEYLNKKCYMYDPFTGEDDIDLIHMIASMDGIFKNTGAKTDEYPYYAIETYTYGHLSSWAGDLQSCTKKLKDNVQNYSLFEGILEDSQSLFDTHDFCSDLDAINIATNKSLISISKISEAFLSYYSSPTSNGLRIKNFCQNILSISGQSKPLTANNLKALVYEMLCVTVDGKNRTSDYIATKAVKYKLLGFDKTKDEIREYFLAHCLSDPKCNSNWFFSTIPSLNSRLHMAYLFFDYLWSYCTLY